jgi:hypothetical protein
MKALLLPLFLVSPVLAPAAVAQGDNSTSPADQAQSAPSSEFGEPLIVNGRRISDLEIRRFLMYGPGRNALEARKLELLMQQEKELREYQGREDLADQKYQAAYDDLSDEQRAEIDALVAESFSYMEVSLDEAKARIAEQNADFKERFPTLDPETETERAYRSVRWYEEQVYQTMRFDEMFFSGHPDTWPEISVEAIHAGSPNYDLVADYAKYYEIRKREADESGSPVKREDDMMMSLLRDYVMSALNSLVEVRTSVDGIDDDLLLTIEGMGFYAEVPIDEIYEQFKDVFTWRDIADAKRFLALEAAAKDKLTKLGVLKDRDEFLAEVADMREKLGTNMFNWNFIALMGHQFPSEEAYTEHSYLLESYKTLIADELVRDESNQISPGLQAHMEHLTVVMGLGRCLTEVLYVSAFDWPRNKWREDGFQGAHARGMALRGEVDAYIDRLVEAEDAKQRAVAAGENYQWPEDLLSFDQYWSNMLDLHSEFWDPPLPIKGKSAPDMGRKNRGRFQGEPMTRNDYKRAMGESSYYYYLYDNTSVTDEVFEQLDQGAVGGPYVAPWGYYIVYLRNRLAPTNPLDMHNERHFNMAVEDYARSKFTGFAHEALAEAETSGVPDGLGS